MFASQPTLDRGQSSCYIASQLINVFTGCCTQKLYYTSKYSRKELGMNI